MKVLSIMFNLAKNFFSCFYNSMRISPISHKQPKFNANSRWVYDKNGMELYKTTTYYFRDDLNWEDIIKYICKKFSDVPKVNFINHACSSGMEPLSFIMSLIIHAPEYVKKFTPILAKDIDKENIEMAKKGMCGVSSDDFLRVERMTKGCYKNFLDLRQSDDLKNLFIMSPKKILTDKVIFQQGDIFDDIEKMPKENTFLSCRNFWMYLPPKKQEELACRLGNHFSSGSTVLLGYLDTLDATADKLLQKYGFKRCPEGTKFINIMYSKV